MSYTEKVLTCSYCGNEFTFGPAEQMFFAANDYTNIPRRCPDCRVGSKAEQGGGFGYYANYSTPRLMYPAICSDCGADTEVPFISNDGRPAYCSKCRRAVISVS